jgi:23S rRNA (cytosine1962-C5)-methyltransferase
MDPRKLWPDFDATWVVFEDDALLAIDKPEGIPSQAADPERPDDVVTRLRAHLEARGDDAYLGVHQRLDKDTSGVLVFTRRRDVNAAVAAQFEGRKVQKRYLAGVTGWKKKGEVVLRDALARGDGGRMRVARRKERGAEDAVSRVLELSRERDRSIVALQLETGRTHQARVQLAHAGAPIAGDRLYGGAVAPRLMLHASELGMVHPRTGAEVRFRAPTPPDLEAWLREGDLGARVYDDPAALRRTLARAVRSRYALGRAETTTALRLVHEAGDALPGLVVEKFADWLVAEFHGDDPELFGNEARRARVLDELFSLGAAGVYMKVRPKQSSTLVDTRREELAPSEPVRGSAAPSELTVLEHGIPYDVRLGDGLQTGFFLDQRNNRLRVREAAKGSRAANLFAYTCSFSVAAAKGGANETVSVDAAVTALERGRANFERAGIACGRAHTFVAEDAFTWLERAKRRGERYDLVVCDPPTYSSTKKRRFVAKDDYVELAAAAMAIVAKGGVLLACVNHRGISKGRFRKILHDAARAAKRDIVQAKDLPVPSDFPAPMGGEPHVKSVWVRLS